MFDGVSGPDISVSLLIDGLTVCICTILLLRYGRLAHSHPAIAYVLFHVIAVTCRVIAIMAGAETMFTAWGMIFEPVTEAEIVRAAFLADVTLVVMTIAWITASVVDLKKNTKARRADAAPRVTLSLTHIWRVVAIAFPIGIIGLALMGNVPGFEKPQIDLGEWQESSWLMVTMTWTGLALLALIYWYGFRWWLITPMMIYLFIMAIQGYHRFRVIIPLILLLQIYLDRRGKRWPPAVVLVPIIVAMLLFFPMKTVGRMAQEGASFDEISQSSTEIVREALVGQHGDQTLLDQLASALTLVDRAGKLYYGTTYLALLTSPIPRQWWPDKPGLAEYIRDYSVPSRPMFEMGMTTSIIGEFYLNFGYPGIVFMSFLTAYWLARVYFKAYRSGYHSILRFAYLMVACNLIQVYRDGLISLFIFTLVNMMPLAVIVILHFIRPVQKGEANASLISVPMSSR
jgi:hypothetical protein